MIGFLRRVWRGFTSAPELRPSDVSRLDVADGLTPGARRWLEDQYPAGTAGRVDAVVRAANGAAR